MQVSLPYGHRRLDIEIPNRNFKALVRPRSFAGKDTRAELERAMQNPLGTSLEEIAAGRRACVLVEDDTRAEPHGPIIEALARGLVEASEVVFVVATGSHDPTTPGNQEIVDSIRRASSRFDLTVGGIHVNDCFAKDFVEIGTTSRGTPVRVNPKILGAELYVVGADMKNHYFAGYSNALKDFLPGACAYETIEANHSWALDSRSTFGIHPLHPDASRRDNPLAADMLEAKGMIVGSIPVFTLATVSSHQNVLWASAGGLEEVTSEGITMVDRLTSFSVEKARYAIVSPGGHPEDESLYHAQRGLELTKNAIRDGGSVLLLAECPNGIAPNDKAKENFYDRLTRPLEEVLTLIESKYELYSHKAYKFAELIMRLREISLFTELDEATVERAHLHKARDPQSVVAAWLKEDPDAEILVFDDANKIAVHAT